MSMKMSLVDIVQDILSDNDGDEVNSISDTTESLQAAYIVRSTFRSLVVGSKIDYYRRAVQFDGLSDLRTPNYLLLPGNIQEMIYIGYDCRKDWDGRKNFKALCYLEPDEFLSRANNLNTSKDNVIVVKDFGGLEYAIQNDKAPDYWTSFDDKHIAFDSYNKDVEDTIHKDKTQGIAFISPEFELTDSYIPDMPADMFPYLVSEAKAQFSAKIRQMTSAKDEQWATLHRRRMSRKNYQAYGGIRTPNYGRNPYPRRNPYFSKD